MFASKGIVARFVDDAVPDGFWANLDNTEELAEESLGTRLGTSLINRVGGTVYPLPGPVLQLAKLSGLSGSDWRYAGAGENLYRQTGAGIGEYNLIDTGLSGQPWGSAVAAPSEITSVPALFVADANKMLKDNGYLPASQQMGIFQPKYPVQAQAQKPDEIVLDAFTASSYTTSGVNSFSPNSVVMAFYSASAVTATGIQSVAGGVGQVGLFQSLIFDYGGANQETILVLALTATGFVANFAKTHPNDVAVRMYGFSGSVPASTVATISRSFGATPISAWPTTLQQADYIGFYLYVGDPTQIQSIQLAFDCGDGSFTENYFYKVIAQGPLQALLTTAATNSSQATTAATDALLDQSLGLYGNSSGSIAELQTGMNNWTPLLIQLSDFAGAGRADFSDQAYNWQNVNGYQLTITMNDNSSVLIEAASLILFGGAGPDSFAGVAYDYLFTFYNNVDGTESNPCMVMSNVNPPNQTNWVLPRRQPVLLTLTYGTLDPQTTSLRIYRRGGTLGDNYRRIDEVLATGSPQTYIDTSADDDIEEGDFVSFVNDVPVTSSLQTPVNTVLAAAIATSNQTAFVYPASMANISVNQQVDIGVIGAIANNFETVVVIAAYSNSFMAFVQNAHAAGETVAATAFYGQPVTIIAQAFGQMWFAGDPNNPNYLYWSAPDNPQAVSSAAYVAVGTPDDPITVVVQFKGNLYVSTRKFWWQVAPGSNQNASPTVYPTAAKHGCVAPYGWVATEEAIFYQAQDGIRAFAGGASSYLTQDQEFIFQGIGNSPIVEADLTQLSRTRAAYWNSMIFFSYVGTDENRHRLIYNASYRRWRNDDVDSQSLFLEVDTNTLVTGDSDGLIHIDRENQSFDQGAAGDVLVDLPIAMNVMTPYRDQGMPEEMKQYQNFVLDANTGGVDVTVTLWFNDGESSVVLGTVNTTERQRVNLNLAEGLGIAAYKVAMQLTASTAQRIYLYQASLQYLSLARTRQSFDTYDLKCGGDDSKFARYLYVEYTATEPINFQVFYDGSTTPAFSFTLPVANGIRQSQRVTLPAVLFRLIRVVATSTGDFQMWSDSCLWYKFACESRGYSKTMLGSTED